MDKNEGSKGKIQEHLSGTTKTEGPVEYNPPTYADLGIDYKDASRLQRAAEHSEAIAVKVAEVKGKGRPVIASRVINQVLQGVLKAASITLTLCLNGRQSVSPHIPLLFSCFLSARSVIHDIRNCLTFIYHRYNIHTMQRVNHHLSDVQMKNLRKLANKTGLSVAELIRRAIDAYLKDSKKGV
ncbi:MAG: hypothetical protein A2132_06290 [Nitrospirae bacterium RBG_16_43_11]|nr:MAG: hypothetical protein A2132_06290 [Nitrospirae bacterium RBG_16_43_11]